MKKQSAFALARRIEEETECYITATPFVAYQFSSGKKYWAISCLDNLSGYTFEVDSAERWEYFKNIPSWDSDQIWEQG